MSDPTPTPAFYQGDSYRLDESVSFMMHSIVTQVTAVVDQRMAELGLTDAQWKPLLMIQQGRASTAAELSRISCVDTGAVTRCLDRIEAKGLVARVRSRDDRRVVNLELTEEGHRVADGVPQVLSVVLNQMLIGFSQDEVDQLKALLKRVLVNTRQLRESVPAAAGAAEAS